MPYAQTVTVDFATANGTAMAGVDYAPKSGTLTFLPGETLKTITVQVFGDFEIEGNETFFVDLSNPSNAVIGDAQGLGTIINDDCTAPPSGLISWWKAEGNATDSAGVNHGVLQNGVAFAPGKVGQAFSFDGVNDSVDLGGWFNLQVFSIGLWVKPRFPGHYADILTTIIAVPGWS